MKTFWNKVNKTDSCWNWTGALNTYGYGHHNKHGLAHRYLLKNMGIDIEGKIVCHTCDNRRCVNPEHLFIGTNQDNEHDKIKKGRAPRKLTPTAVLEIRNGNFTKKELADKYKVSITTIYDVQQYRSWNDLSLY